MRQAVLGGWGWKAGSEPGRPTRCAARDRARDAAQLRVGCPANVGQVVDRRARLEYGEQLAHLEEQLDEAERWHDEERARRLRENIDALREHISAMLGLGGRERRCGSPTERARVSVTRALRRVIALIRTMDVDLGEHLARSVRTGNSCAYWPPEPTTWNLVRAQRVPYR